MDCEEFQKALSLYLEERWSEIDILGDFQEHIKSCEKCAADFEDATDMHEILIQAKSDADALQELADFYSQKGDYGKAVNLLEKVLVLKPGDEKIETLLKKYANLIKKSKEAKVFRLVLDGSEQIYEWDWEEREISLEFKESISLLSGSGEILGEIKASGLSAAYHDGIQDELLYRDNDCIVLLKRGRFEDRLIIRPKNPHN